MKTKDELVCQAYLQGEKINDIARNVRVGISTIYSILERNGIELRSNTKALKNETIQKIDLICELYDKGHSVNRICIETKTSRRSVEKVLTRYRGVNFGEIKTELEKKDKDQEKPLTRKEKVEMIKKLHENGLNIREIMEQTKINQASIEKVLHHGKTGWTEEELFKLRVATQYANGVDLKIILEENNLTREELNSIISGGKM